MKTSTRAFATVAAAAAWMFAAACTSGTDSKAPEAVDPEADDDDPPDPGADDEPPKPDAGVYEGPTRLSDPRVRLFSDIGAKALAPDVMLYVPRFALWSDGAEKTRWVRLPEGSTIDTSDPDHWELPVGTQLFKEFARDGKRLETRLIERIAQTGTPSRDYRFVAFAWNDDESDAIRVPEGAKDVRGTTHDIPSGEQCVSCHSGERGRSLGFTALDLAHEGEGETLASLAARGAFSNEVPVPAFTADEATTAALGYLHANCGHCHNPKGPAWRSTTMLLRLASTEGGKEAVLSTLIGVPTTRFFDAALRVDPGRPDTSALAIRMANRGTLTAMPPLATEKSDPDGLAAVRSWIGGLDGGTP